MALFQLALCSLDFGTEDERFYRTDSSHEFSGHYGLGLAIAKSIADANDAKITVECKDGFVVFKVFFA